MEMFQEGTCFNPEETVYMRCECMHNVMQPSMETMQVVPQLDSDWGAQKQTGVCGRDTIAQGIKKGPIS